MDPIGGAPSPSRSGRKGIVVSSDCPFCKPHPERIIDQGSLTFVLWDAYPVSPGHALVLTRRHVVSFFETTMEERAELLECVDRARAAIEVELKPDGYNIGINDGAAAGQTVPHLHVHVIPRYRGDSADPRGGVRWILRDRADYWSGR